MSEGSWYPMTNPIGTIGTPGDVSVYGSSDVAHHTLTTIEWGEGGEDGEVSGDNGEGKCRGGNIQHLGDTAAKDQG